MKTLLAALFLSLVVSCVLTPWIRRLAPKLGAVDLPSGRRVNKRIIPRLGGIAIAAGFFTPLVALLFYDNTVADLFRENTLRVVGLLVGGLVICGVGALDDVKGVRALYKLYTQLLVATFAYYCGFQIDAVYIPFLGEIQLGIVGFPLTLCWIVGIVNALNLIDGLDGLAGGVALSACVVNIVVGLVSGNLLATLLAMALAGAILGFLFFNFNPASIFMGDSGSMFLGYVLSVSALFGFKGTTAVGLLVPILAMGVPILDTLTAIARRVFSRRPVFASDRHHFHHRLLELGLTHRRAVLFLYGISTLFMIAAILVYMGKDWVVGLTLLGCTLGIAVFIRSVGTLRTSGAADADESELLLWRKEIPLALIGLETAKSQSDILDVLDAFSAGAGLYLARLDGASIENWMWEAPERMAEESMRGYVSCELPLWNADQSERYRLRFGWYSDSGKANPENRAFLWLVADAVERALARQGRQGPLRLVQDLTS